MLTPDQIQALGDQAAQLTAAMEEYLIRDIARRVREAGQLTSTAAYQIWRAQRLGAVPAADRKDAPPGAESEPQAAAGAADPIGKGGV